MMFRHACPKGASRSLLLHQKMYQSDTFEANRVIISEQKDGLARFVGLQNYKKRKKIELSSIIPVQGKAYYDIFSSKIDKITFQTSLF